MDHNGAMPSYVAFLRAINLGPTRKFPKAEIIAATEAAGGTDVATHINTGNVRLTTSLRSRARVEAALEAAYQERTGFVVPTIAFTPVERAAAFSFSSSGSYSPTWSQWYAQMSPLNFGYCWRKASE